MTNFFSGDDHDICARCGASLPYGVTTGVSSLYSPREEFILCEPCFFDEERLIDTEGTNNLPREIAAYRDRLGQTVAVSPGDARSDGGAAS